MTDLKPAESKPSSSKLPLSIMDGAAESPDQVALEDGINDAPVAEGTDPVEPEKPPPRRSSADIEEEAFRCLVDKKNRKKDSVKQPPPTKKAKKGAKQIQKKPAASGPEVKPASGPEVMKRPASGSVVKPVLKRSASAMQLVGFQYEVDACFGTRDRKTFQSLHFHRCKNKLNKDYPHMDHEAVKEKCSEVLARAGKLWDDHHKQ